MKSYRQYLGSQAENMAAQYLLKNNYQIRERNWRYKRAEIDIIAFHKDILVFIEVKCRSYDYYGEPETAVTSKQLERIAHAAQRYMELTGYGWAIRFDIISIRLDPSFRLSRLKHIKDVFF